MLKEYWDIAVEVLGLPRVILGIALISAFYITTFISIILIIKLSLREVLRK